MWNTLMSAVRLGAAGVCLVIGPGLIQPTDLQAFGTCSAGRPDHMCLTTVENYEGKYCTQSGDDCLTCLADENSVCTASGMGSEPGYKDFSDPE